MYYILKHKQNVYGLIAADSDYWIYETPKTVKLIWFSERHPIKYNDSRISYKYSYRHHVWKLVGVKSKIQAMIYAQKNRCDVVNNGDNGKLLDVVKQFYTPKWEIINHGMNPQLWEFINKQWYTTCPYIDLSLNYGDMIPVGVHLSDIRNSVLKNVNNKATYIEYDIYFNRKSIDLSDEKIKIIDNEYNLFNGDCGEWYLQKSNKLDLNKINKFFNFVIKIMKNRVDKQKIFSLQINAMIKQKKNRNELMKKGDFLKWKNDQLNIPNGKDIHFQSLFICLVDLLSFQTQFPDIITLFCGPLYHYICYCLRNNIQTMNQHKKCNINGGKSEEIKSCVDDSKLEQPTIDKTKQSLPTIQWCSICNPVVLFFENEPLQQHLNDPTHLKNLNVFLQQFKCFPGI